MSSRRRSTSASGSSRSRPRPVLRAPALLHQHGRPRRGALARSSTRKAPASRRSSLLRARVGRRSRTGRRAARGSCARPLAPLARARALFRPYLLRSPRRRSSRRRPSRAFGMVAAVRGGARRAARRPDGERVSLETAMASSTPPTARRRRGAAEAVTVALEPGLRTRTSIFNTILVDKSIDDRLRGYPTWISSRNLANETTETPSQALVERRPPAYDVPQRYYRLKAKLLGLDKLEYYDRFAPVADDSSKTPWDEARASSARPTATSRARPELSVERFFDDGLDRRPRSSGQAPRRVLRDERPGRPPVRVHELHRRPPLDPHPRPRARPRTARDDGAATRALQRVHTADDGRDGVGVRRGTDVQALARLGGRPTQEARPPHRAARGRDRDDVPADRDESVREPRPHASGASTASSPWICLNELWLECQSGLFGDSVGAVGYDTWWSYIPHFTNVPGYVYAYAYGYLFALAIFRSLRARGRRDRRSVSRPPCGPGDRRRRRSSRGWWGSI